MESKRLGLCQKSLFVVPNHLTEQWASEFLRLYPSKKTVNAQLFKGNDIILPFILVQLIQSGL